MVYDVEKVRASYPIFEPSIWVVDSMKIFPYATNGYRTAKYYQQNINYPAIFPSSPFRDTSLAMYGYNHIPLTADSVVNVYDFMLEKVPSNHETKDWIIKLSDVWGYSVEASLEVETDTVINSLNDINLTNNFKIYPNPTVNKLFIAFDIDIEFKEIKVYDTHAKLVISEQAIDKLHMLDLSNINSGIYILTIDNQSIKFCKK